MDPWLSSDGRLLAFSYRGRPYVGDRRARHRKHPRRPRGSRHILRAPQFRLGSHDAFSYYEAPALSGSTTGMCRSTDAVRRAPRCGKPFTDNRGYWAWGPGRTILSIDTDERRDICVTDLNGRCRKVLVKLQSQDTFFMPPSTSPDDRYIAVGVEQSATDETRLELFSARTGRHVRTLTRGHDDYPPSFSPDGRWVAFRRDAVVAQDGTRSSICVVRVRGGRVRCLIQRGHNLGRPIWGG